MIIENIFSNSLTDIIGNIATIFTIADSLLSFVITYVMQRQAMFRWRKELGFSLILLWSAVILTLFEPMLGSLIPKMIGGFIVNNLLVKISIITWSAGIIILLIITHKIFTLDFIQFNKKDLLGFKHNKPRKWGIKTINEILDIEKDQDIYFPIIIYADEYTRPWKILQRFFVSGLTYSSTARNTHTGGIYFTFTRPAHEIFKNGLNGVLTKLKAEKSSNSDIMGQNETIDWKKVVIIDCYTQSTEKYAKSKNKNIPPHVLDADPNNPHDLNKKYEQAIKILKSECCENIRVVYDAISDFLKFTDKQLATQYLRHNMGYEFREGIESLYLFKTKTLDKVDEKYFLWFANGTLKLEIGIVDPDDDSKDVIKADFRGPFVHTKRFKMDFNY